MGSEFARPEVELGMVNTFFLFFIDFFTSTFLFVFFTPKHLNQRVNFNIENSSPAT